MNTVPTNPVLDLLNNTIPNYSTLTNGMVINHKWYLTGGGQMYYPYFLKAIAQYGGKQKYDRGYEWCCGHGVIGWEVLTQGFCNEMTFSDCYDLAVYTCLQNAKDLGFENVVTGYTTPTITGIPSNEKWDLVVGNPPNGIDSTNYIRDKLDPNQPPEMMDLAIRLTFDNGFKAHTDFFANIQQHLTDDADIFLTAQETLLSYLKSEILKDDFNIVNIIHMTEIDPGLKIIHIKANNT
jgi:methylase of polypeptide subunit release factors